jgi:8-oxo-dGTP diphosphatase
MFRYAFCFVFNDDGKVLVIRRSQTAHHRAGDWDLPGGVVMGSETAEKAIVREIKEETALNVTRLELLGRGEREWDGATHQFSYYRAQSKLAEVHLSYEHDAFEWHEPLLAGALFMFRPHKLAHSMLIGGSVV